MKTFFSISLLMLLLFAISAAHPSAAQEQADKAITAESPRPEPAAFKNVDGELSRVDEASQSLWIKRTDGKEMEFNYTSQTQVTGGDNSMQGLAKMSSGHLRIQYQTVGDTNQAVKIEILPS